MLGASEQTDAPHKTEINKKVKKMKNNDDDHQSFSFSTETPEEITEKVAAVMKGIAKSSSSGINESLEKKGAIKASISILNQISDLDLTVEEAEYLLDAFKFTIKQQTCFKLPK